ncbi:FtsW/RodA/SpoVE family cell cycle protein [Selenomonas sp. ND2010]|uniref:FtsW/RodA/SpoVE family cell cycle protein n=1 Tax=Selenomonas sp. ND2010 TaxID=1410618 RepID=UPI00051BC3B2|nr:FtsW/RodA/SpoVE family cell cycle protein [Selenomonas sp. ND2010]
MKNWGLMAAPLGIVLFGMSVLYLKMNPGGSKLTAEVLQGPLNYVPWLAAVIILALFIQAVIIKRREDTFLFPIVLTLCSVGIVEIARLKPALLVRQLQWLCVAMVVMILVLRFWGRIRRMLGYPYLLGLACIFLLGLPLLFGTEIGGSKNWLVLGPISIQPSEFGKILIVFFLAAYLSDHRRVLTLPAHRIFWLQLPPLRFIAPLICIWGMAVLMFVVEKDLGSALLFFGMAVLMTYMATGSKSYVFLAMAFIGVAAAASYAAFGHVRVRFDIWLNPWQDPNGMAYQVVQSLFAFGTGGIWGTGFGYGHPGFIPEVHTDFIFAAIAEEMGLIATMMLMSCYVFFFWRGIKTALSCRKEKEVLLAAGCCSLMLLQAFIIVAGVTKFLPLTGITLPFISYGGSSMVSSFVLLGLLISLSKEQEHG